MSKQDKIGKLYRETNQASVFSLDGDEDDDGKETNLFIEILHASIS